MISKNARLFLCYRFQKCPFGSGADSDSCSAKVLKQRKSGRTAIGLGKSEERGSSQKGAVGLAPAVLPVSHISRLWLSQSFWHLCELSNNSPSLASVLSEQRVGDLYRFGEVLRAAFMQCQLFRRVLL